jgi:hypothetical protein
MFSECLHNRSCESPAWASSFVAVMLTYKFAHFTWIRTLRRARTLQSVFCQKTRPVTAHGPQAERIWLSPDQQVTLWLMCLDDFSIEARMAQGCIARKTGPTNSLPVSEDQVRRKPDLDSHLHHTWPLHVLSCDWYDQIGHCKNLSFLWIVLSQLSIQKWSQDKWKKHGRNFDVIGYAFAPCVMTTYSQIHGHLLCLLYVQCKSYSSCLRLLCEPSCMHVHSDYTWTFWVFFITVSLC